jgi:hypothetical protein
VSSLDLAVRRIFERPLEQVSDLPSPVALSAAGVSAKGGEAAPGPAHIAGDSKRDSQSIFPEQIQL